MRMLHLVGPWGIRGELGHKGGTEESICNFSDIDVLITSYIGVSLIILRGGEREVLVGSTILGSSQGYLDLASLTHESLGVLIPC